MIMLPDCCKGWTRVENYSSGLMSLHHKNCQYHDLRQCVPVGSVISDVKKIQKRGTFFLVKPKGISEGHLGVILARLEANDFAIIDLKMKYPSKAQAIEFYMQHQGAAYFDGLIDYLQSGPVVAGTCYSRLAHTQTQDIEYLRELIGPYNTVRMGTIRGEHYFKPPVNVIHASDHQDAVEHESKLWGVEL
jgi:nucleoside-diphosphate kinase